MECLPCDILRQILCLIDSPKDLTELIRVNTQILQTGRGDLVWKHYLNCLHASFVEEEDTQQERKLSSPEIVYYHSLSSMVYQILHPDQSSLDTQSSFNFKAAFQDLKEEYSKCIVMMKFYDYQPWDDYYKERNSSFFVSPTKYLFKDFIDQPHIEYYERSDTSHEVWCRDSVTSWLDNDTHVYSPHNNILEEAECEKIVKHLQECKNLIYLDTDLRSISTAIYRRHYWENTTFIKSSAVNSLQRITINQFKELSKSFSHSIWNDVHKMFPNSV